MLHCCFIFQLFQHKISLPTCFISIRYSSMAEKRSAGLALSLSHVSKFLRTWFATTRYSITFKRLENACESNFKSDNNLVPLSTPSKIHPRFPALRARLLVLLSHLWKIKVKFTTHVPLNLLHLRPLNLILRIRKQGEKTSKIPKSISRTISLRFGREITKKGFSFRGKNFLTLLKFSIISRLLPHLPLEAQGKWFIILHCL